MILLLLVLQNLLTYGGTEGLELSSLIPLCSSKDPKLNECVKEAAQKFIPLMGDGISEWNVPSLDPLTAPQATFKNEDGVNNLEVEYRNVVQTGFSSTIIENVKEIDLDRGILSFKLKYPCTIFLADYTTKGKMFDFNFYGRGKANATAWNTGNDLVINYHVEANHIRLNSVKFSLHFDKVYLDYPNLTINEDEKLSQSASSFLNENGREVMEGMKSQMEEFYEKIMGKALQNFFDSVPYSALFKSD